MMFLTLGSIEVEEQPLKGWFWSGELMGELNEGMEWRNGMLFAKKSEPFYTSTGYLLMVGSSRILIG